MGDHLTIGILLGIASGIAALIVIAAVTLHRLDARHAETLRLQRLLSDLQRTLRVELAAVRRDAQEAARAQERLGQALGERLAQLTGAAVTALREHPLPPLAALAEAQEQQLALLVEAQEQRLAALAGELARLSEVMAADAAGHAKDLRNELLESLRMTLDEFRAAHAAQVTEVRAAVEENLERAVERRLGETFRLVTERLEVVNDRLDNVHRALGEVQSFAAGLGHLQRAVATVRLGGSRSSSEGGGHSSARPRTPRRKPAAPAAVGPSPVEASEASVS